MLYCRKNLQMLVNFLINVITSKSQASLKNDFCLSIFLINMHLVLKIYFFVSTYSVPLVQIVVKFT